MSKTNIAVTVALVVVLGTILVFAPSSERMGGPRNLPLFSGLSLPFSSKVPNLNDSFNVTAAWSTFQDYLKFAKAHDLEGVKSLSYQVSEACSNPEKITECERLMDSVSQIGAEFKLEDFKSVFYDDKQIIMSTDHMVIMEGLDKTKIVLFFVKSDVGEPKVLGIRLCFGGESGNNTCVITDPETRDADKDGWWDDVEALFHK
ncbi:MAG: hypothetical protein AAB780_00680 [Patescibacteria group bacterium]